MATPQWIKKLGGHAGEQFVAGELSKRGIPNALLPENFSDDDIIVGSKLNESIVGYIQVKSCHPDRSDSFLLTESAEVWAKDNRQSSYCILVWLGKTTERDPPRYWIAYKHEIGTLCLSLGSHGTSNWERRLYTEDLPREWESRWELFNIYQHKI